MTKILIVEDDLDILLELKNFLSKEFEIITANTYEKAKQDLAVDLVLLDLNLGDKSGFDLIADILKNDAALIIISVLNDEENIIKGLELGAYDYITKPFSINILRSRINSVLRRKNNINYFINSDTLNPYIIIDGKEIKLTAKELQILEIFQQNKRNVITREQLLNKVWDIDGTFIEDNTLTVTISRLKKKIGAEKIETIRGIGYRWRT